MAAKKQLQMVWPEGRGAPAVFSPPDGYRLRTFKAGDEDAYVSLMRSAGFETWSAQNAAAAIRTALPEGLFFVETRPDGAIVATAAAQRNPADLASGRAELGWVAVSPAHRGRRLGAVVCAAAVRRLVSAGCARIHLKTDDFRLAAITVYLRLGFVPLLFAGDMESRWRAVCETLGVRFERIGAIVG